MPDAYRILDYRERFPPSCTPVSCGYRAVELVAPGELADAQIGYAVDLAGNNLCGAAAGEWSTTWLVVAREDELGDPIFVETADPSWPVYTAMHGDGTWEPVCIAESFENFVTALELVRRLAVGRETPVALEENPISPTERAWTLRQIERENPNAAMSFWELWLGEL